MAITALERVAASKLARKEKNGTITEEESEKLKGYRDKVATAKRRRASEKITYTEERSAEEGEGAGAENWASEAAAITAEGRRMDHMAEVAIKALLASVDCYKSMTKDLLDRQKNFDDAHIELLGVVRDHYLAKIEAEGEAMQAQQGEQTELGEIVELMHQAPELLKSLKAMRGDVKGKPKNGAEKSGKDKPST